MSHYDLYAIGNALVDSEYPVSDALLKTMGVDKRHMTLIDTPRRAQLLAHVKNNPPGVPVAARLATPWWRWRNWAAEPFTPAK